MANLTMADKLAIINFHREHPNMSLRAITKMLSNKMKRRFSKTTITKIVRNKEAILNANLESAVPTLFSAPLGSP